MAFIDDVMTVLIDSGLFDEGRVSLLDRSLEEDLDVRTPWVYVHFFKGSRKRPIEFPEVPDTGDHVVKADTFYSYPYPFGSQSAQEWVAAYKAFKEAVADVLWNDTRLLGENALWWEVLEEPQKNVSPVTGTGYVVDFYTLTRHN